MNLFQDILGLFTRKFYTKTVKDRDFIVVGIDNNPEGILNPTPPQIKLMKSRDFISNLTLLTNKTISGSYNILKADMNKMLICDDTTTITVPDNISIPIGAQILIASDTTNTISFVAAPGVTINSKSGLVDITDQYGVASLVKTGTSTWYLFGDLT